MVVPHRSLQGSDNSRLNSHRIGRVWALIFNFKSEKETIYAQQMGEDGQEYVITWQEREDAHGYAQELADAHGYPGGTAVQVFTAWLLDTVCKEATHTLCLIPSSTVVIPPKENAPMEGLVSGGAMTEENLRRRRKEYDALLEGMDTGDTEEQKDIFQYLNGGWRKRRMRLWLSRSACSSWRRRTTSTSESMKRGCSRRRKTPTKTHSESCVLMHTN